MSKLLFSFAVSALLLCLFPSALCARQASPRQVAALIEEVTALRDEVNRLRMDVEDLRSENARLRENLERKSKLSENASEIASLRVEINNKLETLRREICAGVDKRIAEMVANTNAALEKMRSQVNKALAGGQSSGSPAPATPLKEPKDLPENGITYKIKKGDTLSKIAREHRSKLEWILYLNPGLNANNLSIGKEIVIPVAE